MAESDLDPCDQCSHANGPHLIAGNFTAPQYLHGVEVPVAGWRTCPEDGCHCWSTWSISHPDLPADLVALIEDHLDHLRDERASSSADENEAIEKSPPS